MRNTAASSSFCFLLLSLGCILFVTACIPPSETTYSGVALDVNDPLTRKLAMFQDAHQTDSLLPYLEHENPSYRYFAARAFGSYTDTVAHPLLLALLNDPFDQVRAAAAYALGQQEQPEEPTLEAAILERFNPDTSGRYDAANEAILQAIGKIGTASRLQQLVGVETYRAKDTSLMRGMAWAIFYFGRRGFSSPQANQRALELSRPPYPDDTRFPALAFLSRYPPALDSSQTAGLEEDLPNTQVADLRMLQVAAIAKSGSQRGKDLLIRQFNQEEDWRVRVNILRALRNYPYASIRSAALTGLEDQHQLVSQSAAELLLAKGSAEDATMYWSLARDSFPWQTRYKLYQAANRYLPIYFTDYRGSINYQLQQRFQRAASPYQQAAILSALSDFPWNYRIIQELGYNSTSEVVRTAAVQALVYISKKSDFAAFFRNSARRVRAELSVYLRQAVETGDVGMIYEASQALSPEGNPYIGLYEDLDWANTALQNLPLPQAVESYRALEGAIARLEGGSPPTSYPAPEYNHPIEWKPIEDAGANPTVRIHTSRGDITVELWPELAPGTVSSFLRLASAGFYRNKPFHRVVPNFVAQGGDPRGDGYGATDFSLRTETPPLHWTGSGLIGLASAGRDTEGVQFFLTHSGVPHLDGRYTAFGRVAEGQEVVDALQIGDLIERVEIR